MSTAQPVLFPLGNTKPHTLAILFCSEMPHSDDPKDIRRLLEDFLESLSAGESPCSRMHAEPPHSSAFFHPAEISDILCQLGMPSNLLGYRYLHFAIRAAAKDPELLRAVTKILYPMVADKFSASASGVERAMRHAIEVVWTRGDPDVLLEYFGNTIDPDRGKPTNTEFIAKIVDKLIIEGNERSHK